MSIVLFLTMSMCFMGMVAILMEELDNDESLRREEQQDRTVL